jgi:hypothetical protein
MGPFFLPVPDCAKMRNTVDYCAFLLVLAPTLTHWSQFVHTPR